jgi:hypothetical protein
MSEATDRLEATISKMPYPSAARLSHGEKCAAFYAMRRGFPKWLIAKTFGITPTTASYIANCLAPPEGAKPRYENIAREFRAMGEKEFGEKYYTIEIDDRIARIRADVVTPEDATRRKFGPAKTLNRLAGFHRIPTDYGRDEIVEVRWIDEEGWTFSEMDQTMHPSRNMPRFDAGVFSYNWTAPDRFKSSRTALQAAWVNYGNDAPSVPELPKPLKPPAAYRPDDE